jgi:Zn finger protein HypA/HybF involved in hydrogenase expression
MAAVNEGIYHVKCDECRLGYSCHREPEVCGACGSSRIEVWTGAVLRWDPEVRLWRR